ncbi:hypothetical protein B9Z55_009304 [Caenorhabditis nigoni]|uniref:G-protein coupled receptors family 1 profile domain-containing protein n=1 Tax=Caenorhabditis nigoni TaxID=1611254 RepID=A0A2G5URG8_9PELO|nr:hypothetical protein B9Z55_009304 [Caenorhabditis nigoni]
MTNLFENCSYHSSYEPYFLDCTNATDPCYLIQYVDTIEVIIYWLNLVIPFILLTTGLFLNAYYLTVLLPNFIQMNDM